MLRSDFEVGWFDIRREDYVGYSSGYSYKAHCAVGTTNGAGGHNVQIFVLSSDKVVLHALPGFWAPEDLARELRFAKVLHRLWQDDSRTLAEKRDMNRRLQIRELRSHPAGMYARSAWQGFDALAESARHKQGARDTSLGVEAPALPSTVAGVLRQLSMQRVGSAGTLMKPLNVLVHERMAARPFLAFDDFDTQEFVDYGRLYYDLNARHGRGIQFAGQAALKKKRKIVARKERLRARRRG